MARKTVQIWYLSDKDKDSIYDLWEFIFFCGDEVVKKFINWIAD